MTTAMRRRPRTLWEEGRWPVRDVLSLASAVLLTATVLDLLLSEGLGLFHDLVFVSLCVATALTVAPRGFFAVAIWPPLAMLAVVVLLAISDRSAVARPDDDLVQAVVSGLSDHALALALGYAACLGILGMRRTYL